MKTIFPYEVRSSVSSSLVFSLLLSPCLPLSPAATPFVFTLFTSPHFSSDSLPSFSSPLLASFLFSLVLRHPPLCSSPSCNVTPRTLAVPRICRNPRISCRGSKSTFASHPTVKLCSRTALPLPTRLTRICWRCPNSCRHDYFSRPVYPSICPADSPLFVPFVRTALRSSLWSLLLER